MSKQYSSIEDEEPINVKVMTSDLANPDANPQVMIINYGDYGQRKWLAKHSWWAFKTGHMISTVRTSEPVTFIHRERPNEHRQ